MIDSTKSICKILILLMIMVALVYAEKETNNRFRIPKSEDDYNFEGVIRDIQTNKIGISDMELVIDAGQLVVLDSAETEIDITSLKPPAEAKLVVIEHSGKFIATRIKLTKLLGEEEPEEYRSMSELKPVDPNVKRRKTPSGKVFGSSVYEESSSSSSTPKTKQNQGSSSQPSKGSEQPSTQPSNPKDW